MNLGGNSPTLWTQRYVAHMLPCEQGLGFDLLQLFMVDDVEVDPALVAVPSGSEDEGDGDESVQSNANAQTSNLESESYSEEELEAELPSYRNRRKRGRHG